jgi:hypothetical protein
MTDLKKIIDRQEFHETLLHDVTNCYGADVWSAIFSVAAMISVAEG